MRKGGSHFNGHPIYQHTKIAPNMTKCNNGLKYFLVYYGQGLTQPGTPFGGESMSQLSLSGYIATNYYDRS